MTLLERLYDADAPPEKKQRQPLFSLYVGPDQIDCFSPRRITNREGETLLFDEVYPRSEVKRDPKGNFSIRLPRLDDLIALKKCDPPDPLKQARNLEDIRYLLTLKSRA